jgi:hypothetical protein
MGELRSERQSSVRSDASCSRAVTARADISGSLLVGVEVFDISKVIGAPADLLQLYQTFA